MIIVIFLHYRKSRLCRGYRFSLPDTIPNIRKDNSVEKIKRAAPKRFRPAAPKPTIMHLPLPEAPLKPKNDASDSQPLPSVPVCESIPWPGTGKVSGNLFEDKNWLLPPNYLDNGNENKSENDHKIMTVVTGPKSSIKEEEEPKVNEQSTEKCSWGPDCPSANPRRRKKNKTRYNNKRYHPYQSCRSHRLEDQTL